MAEKGWVPLRYWVVWWTALALAMVLFYVVLTPIWLGLRAAGVGCRAPLAAPLTITGRGSAMTGGKAFDLGAASGAARRGSRASSRG